MLVKFSRERHAFPAIWVGKKKKKKPEKIELLTVRFFYFPENQGNWYMK